MIALAGYALFVALLFGLCASSGERLLAQLRFPRRGVWVAALLVSSFLPISALLTNADSADPAIISFPPILSSSAEEASSALGSELRSLTDTPWLRWPEWSASNASLATLWMTCSALVVAAFLVFWFSVNRKIRRLESRDLEGQQVFLSDSLGPAVFGFIRPYVILPYWLLDNADMRTLVLRHEREHIEARDQLVLLAALLLVAATPWNLALWWQLRRLRSAIEVDCDARVLGKGTDATSYSEALLFVRQRFASIPLGAVALGEPTSDLERRITIMMDRTQTFRVSLFCRRLALAASLGFLACAVNAPAQERTVALQPVWPEFRPAVDSYAGSIAANDGGLSVLTLVYDDSGTLLGSDYRRFAEIDHPYGTANDESAKAEFAEKLEPVTAHAATVFESYNQPMGEPIFFRSPVDETDVLLIWASSEFIETTMNEKRQAALQPQ